MGLSSDDVTWPRGITMTSHERHGVSFKSPATPLLFQHLQISNHEIIKYLHYCFYEGNPPLVSGFPSQRSCNVDSVSMSWRHDVIGHICMHENVFMVRWQRLGQPRVNHFFVFLKYHPTCFNIEPDEITINFVHPGLCIAKHHALCSWRC